MYICVCVCEEALVQYTGGAGRYAARGTLECGISFLMINELRLKGLSSSYSHLGS